MTTFYLFFTIAVFLLLYLYFTRNFDHWKNKNVPFLKPLPFFGNIFDGITMHASMDEIFHSIYKQMKTPIVGFFILDKPCLLIRDPQIIKRILITDFQHFYDRSIMSNKRDDPIAAYVLFVLKNPEWREMRTKVSKLFSTTKMKSMSKLIEDVSDEMVDYLTTRMKIDPIIDIKDINIKYTVDVISSAVFGVNSNSFKNESSQFCLEARKLTDWDNIATAFRLRCYFLAHSLVKLFRMKMLHPTAIKFLRSSFLEILDIRASSKNAVRNDLVDILLQITDKNELFADKDKLVSQAVMFFVAGFETSSSALGFALHEMALHPEIQTKLRDEINRVSEKHNDITYESLKEMEYLDMCVKEVLRKYPVLSFLERKCNSDYTIPETGTTIDKETPVFISAYALQHDPEYYPDPETFDPQRFSEENKHKIGNCLYLPFGEGPRNCIGARFGTLSVKFGLANQIKNFTVKYPSGIPVQKEIKFNPNGVVLSPHKKIKLEFEKN